MVLMRVMPGHIFHLTRLCLGGCATTTGRDTLLAVNLEFQGIANLDAILTMFVATVSIPFIVLSCILNRFGTISLIVVRLTVSRVMHEFSYDFSQINL